MTTINLNQTHLFMREAVPLARQLEGDWTVRMKMALNSVIVNYHLSRPLTIENVNELLRRGVSYRRICKNYGIRRKDLTELQQSSIV
ncbi:hypothetical protein P9306_00745 [Bacillus atrophaeus]|nr:hypothetical protein [Bacillus atrophaeus]MEC1900708.1 hypothetical protein [Bacillus atrophaeus]MEC2396543.1 hypothetical protein [Bacillus atrophaeus]MED4436198.1 hypothetical protein [Bacillus atrophaeus]MED4563804.1 hypothetical protein [Bacillus atrophaeus]MED4575155.1 hypothetical protein [Bacillus atrophaeus]